MWSQSWNRGIYHGWHVTVWYTFWTIDIVAENTVVNRVGDWGL